MLKIKELRAGYGNVRVLHGVSLEVRQGELVSLVGANGAGKTTTLKVISGLLPAFEGTIEFQGVNITRLPSNQIVEMGLIQVPEGRKLFPSMTVLENLEMGAYTARARREREKNLAWVYELFPKLRERLDQMAGTLSGGEQQMLAIGRALMSCPSLLILDEPSIGLSPLLTQKVFEVVARIRDEGVTVLLVEQNVQHALEMASRGYVIENGSIVMEGTGRQLLHDEHLKKAYLGL